jgi:membrane-bound lytic murein transglycosylase F
MWFALAAYNAGPGHVFDARILARRQGWDADRWFGDVDKAMLLLGKREYASKARHGWVRGREPVNYVASIRDRYQAYVDHFEQLEARSVTGYSNNEPVSR